MKNNHLLYIILLTLVPSWTLCQIDSYDYQSDLTIRIDTSDGWVSIPLPNAVYDHANRNLSDVRIYEISAINDTVETPFILQQKQNSIETSSEGFTIINRSQRDGQYFFTFYIENKTLIDNINLNFEESNYDYRVKLEGGQSLNDMATILDDYRILSFRNNPEDYEFNRLAFGKSDYKYYKLTVPSSEKVTLIDASLSVSELIGHKEENFNIEKQRIRHDNKYHNTIIDVELGHRLPVATVKLDIADPSEYYRPVKIEGLIDSVNTPKGWRRNYKNIYNGTLSSLESNAFSFRSYPFQNLRITIKNYNSPPVKIEKISASGVRHELITRLEADSKYVLCYGNKGATTPRYDLQYFRNNLADNHGEVTIGRERKLKTSESEHQADPLFTNELWLWALLVGLVIIISVATMGMIKEEKPKDQ